ncbi:MAG: hypothetical protein Q9217_001688, partial [Psora testacea]
LELIVGAAPHHPFVRLCAMPSPSFIVLFGILLLSTSVFHHFKLAAPFRVSSQPKGSQPLRPGTYTILEDVLSVDTGVGRRYRKALQERYEASRHFRRLLWQMDLFWGIPAFLVGVGVMAAVGHPDVNESIAYGLGWAVPPLWAITWAVVTTIWVKLVLKREKAWRPIRTAIINDLGDAADGDGASLGKRSSKVEWEATSWSREQHRRKAGEGYLGARYNIGMSEGKEDPKPEQTKEGAGVGWAAAPQHYGNLAGDKMQSTLGKVGGPVGTGASYVAAPAGNVVDSVLGGVMRSGELAHDSPKHGEGLEDKVRDLAGRVTGQGQEAVGKGQGAMKNENRGNGHGEDAMDNMRKAVEGAGGETG